MLVPAAAAKTEIEAAFAALLRARPGYLRWYRMGSASRWIPEVPTDDWHRVARASMSAGEVVGYMAAMVDREPPTVTEIAAVALRPGSVTFMRDLERFADELRRSFVVVRFTCAVGNPAERIWRRWVEAHDGREVGVLHAYGQSATGEVLDVRLFEVPGTRPTVRAG